MESNNPEKSEASNPVISASQLTRVFGSGSASVVAVDNISLDIMPGERVAFIGRSGSGKTTLLNLLSGLDQPTSGEVFYRGNNLASFSESGLVELRRRKISFVFQSFGLMPLLSAQENVELPLHLAGLGWRERRHRAQDALELVGLRSRAHHRPYELSGGEQQRASIARALVTGPEVMFADEPTGELDTTNASTIAAILREISANQGTTVLIATHDPALAASADRTLEMADGALI